VSTLHFMERQRMRNAINRYTVYRREPGEVIGTPIGYVQGWKGWSAETVNFERVGPLCTSRREAATQLPSPVARREARGVSSRPTSR